MRLASVILFFLSIFSAFGQSGGTVPGGGSSLCTLTGSQTTNYVLTATDNAKGCSWQTVGGASVDANTVKNAIFLTDTGTANLVSGTTTTAYPGSYAVGQCVAFKANATNTGATLININSLGNKNLTKFGSTALAAGNKVSGTVYMACFDSTQFQLLQPTLIAADIPTLNQNTTGTASNLSGTPALPNGTTATTQSQGDGTTKLATDAYVDTGLGTKVATSNTCNLTSTANPTFDTTTCNGTPGSYTYWKMIVNANVASLSISNLVDSVPYVIKLVHDGTANQYTIATASNLSGMPFFPSNVANEYVVFAFSYSLPDTQATVTAVATSNVFSGIPTTTCTAVSIGNADSGTVRACADATRAANCAISSTGVVSCGVPDVASTANQFATSLVNGVLIKAQPSAANLSNGTTGSGGSVVLATGPTISGATLTGSTALGTPASGTLTNATGLPEAGLTLANNTTNDVSITKHGFAPLLPNDATKFLNGVGGYTVPAGSGSGGGGVSGYSGAGLTISGTQYFPIMGGGAPSGTEASVDLPSPAAAVIGNFYVETSAVPGAGNSIAITFRKNSSNTTVTCTITAAVTSCNDTVHSFTPATADILTVQTVTTGTIVGTLNLMFGYTYGTTATGILTFNGRGATAAVPTSGDYTAAQVTNAFDKTASNTMTGGPEDFTGVVAKLGPAPTTQATDFICNTTTTVAPYACTTNVGTTETYYSVPVATIAGAATAGTVDGIHSAIKISTVWDTIMASGTYQLTLRACSALSGQTCTGAKILWESTTKNLGALQVSTVIDCNVFATSTATTFYVGCNSQLMQVLGGLSPVRSTLPNNGTNWVIVWTETFGQAGSAQNVLAQIGTNAQFIY